MESTIMYEELEDVSSHDVFQSAPVGLAVLDQRGFVENINSTGAGYFGIPREDIIHRHLISLVSRDYYLTVASHLRRVIDTGESHSCEALMLRKNTSGFRVLMESVCFPGECGTILGERILTAIIDLTGCPRHVKDAWGIDLSGGFSIPGARDFQAVPAGAAQNEKPAGFMPPQGKESMRPAAGRSAVRGRILLMDDETLILKTTAALLRHYGYEADTTTDGESMLRLYRDAHNRNTPYDVVIMDLSIPGRMGGKEAIAGLLEINPAVKAVVTSGYSNDPAVTDYREHGFLAALPKPYNFEVLFRILRNILPEIGTQQSE